MTILCCIINRRHTIHDAYMGILLSCLMDVKEKIFTLSKQLHYFSEQKIPLKRFLGFSDALMESKYAIAYELYKKGEWTKAVECFSYLANVNPYETKYWIALATCQMEVRDFSSALNSYSSLTALDAGNPHFYFQLAYCFFQLEKISEGKEALEEAITIAKEDHQYRELEDRSRKLLQVIEEHSFIDQFSEQSQEEKKYE